MPLSGGETCVGSDPSVQIPVRADFGLMPRHFAVAPQNGGWYLGAYEGAAVWVNGQPVTMTELNDGDRIVAGQLELVYRDEQVAAAVPVLSPQMRTITSMPAAGQGHVPLMPSASTTAGMPTLLSVPPMAPPSSMGALSLTPLSMDGGISGGEEGSHAGPRPAESRVSDLERPAYAPPSLSRPPSLARPPAEEWKASDRYNPQKWSALKMGGLGLLLAGMGLFACYVAMFELPGPLKQGDLVIKEARIVNAITHRQRKGRSWTEIMLAPAMQRVIELPDDIPMNPAWGKGIAKIGFVKKYHDDTHLNMLGTQVPLRVATLEVDGKSYRSLAKHNNVQEGENRLITLAGPFMVIGGVFLLMLGWEKGKAKRG